MDVLAIILEALLGLIFLMAGATKIFGVKMQVDSFKSLRLPQWFRVVTGLVQYVGVAGIIIGFWEPSWAAWAGIWLGFTMLCAVAAHIRVRHTFAMTFPAVILMLLAIVIALMHSSELVNFPG
ncbi:DoxX family protein [Paenibacillus psychroresistens]|uniref:DoxX family protein n=1 Tax=Paenibacillus psychroresistens TaxID=1778678 RepID=A0A6B8RSM1_9BACL|nr:DoxX family protein [Paenibacillus psychroresistens]QGQ98929.1 DoxX family protein [Paenibacillus psychroresistens]